MKVSDGMNFAPKGKPAPVVEKGEFTFSAVALDHGHIYGMCNGLIEAGGVLKSVWDSNPERLKRFVDTYPGAVAARSEDEVLSDSAVQLVAGAAVTSERCGLGLRVLSAGKDYFTDKAPLTTLEQLAAAKAKVAETGKKYMVYYCERIHNEAAVFAGQLIDDGAIGRVVQVLGLGPHRLGKAGRPDWFFQKEKYGGILCDIGSHQIEQYLAYTGETDAAVVRSQIANYNNPDHPELDDFGDAALVGANGSTNYFRVDWFTPDGLQMWGDGRAFILGTDGFIELRKFMNITTDDGGSQVYLANHVEESHYSVAGKVGCPYFGQLILDCLNRTENAMTQDHAFKAAELSIKAQMNAVRLK
ncbi:oxidoreductase [Clostridia bacterium]|nr:oxidoreductase [Clostridia bacterium]